MNFHRLFFIFLLIFGLYSFDARPEDYKFVLIHDHTLSKNLIDLLDLFEMYPSSVKEAVDMTQRKWIRKKERWKLKETHQKQKPQILNCVDQLGLLKKKDPQKKHYDQAILLGASLFSFQNRLQFLIEKWQQGVRFDTLILLGSDRPLDPEYEKPFLEPYALNTEMQMMERAFEMADVPKKMREVKVLKLKAPMYKTAQGYRRANTLDTIYLWLENYPPKENCLFISNQPFIDYQNAIVHTTLPNTIDAETVGDKANLSLPSSVFLDSVARLLFVETLIKKQTELVKVKNKNAESIN